MSGREGCGGRGECKPLEYTVMEEESMDTPQPRKCLNLDVVRLSLHELM